jgi:HK97 family phage prohead protease
MPARAKKKKADMAPADLVARWARGHQSGVVVPLRSQFADKPQCVRMSGRGAIDELREILRGADAPKRTMERALDESETGEDVSVWTCSTKAVDSYKTTFNPDGWVLDHFERNPVVLFAHDRGSMPIGKDVGAWIQPKKALKGVTRYAPADVNPFGHAVGAMVRWGGLNAVSVGFEPIEFEINEERDDGESFFVPVDFLSQRLLEYSVVPVPSNPEAVLEGRTLRDHLRAEGVDIRAMVEWCERALDGEALPNVGPLNVPRLLVERARKAIVSVGDGLVLAPSSYVRADDDEEKPPVAEGETPDEEEEEERAADDAAALCPECGHEGVVGDFVVEAEPSEEEVAELDEVPERALLAQCRKRGLAVGQVDHDEDGMSESDLDGLEAHLAMTARRAAEQAMVEVDGQLPGGRSSTT